MSKAGEKLVGSARDALAFARGGADPASCRVHIPDSVDVRAVRGKTGLTQVAFAARFGVSVRTLQDWEQDRRFPEGAARVLLTVIDREPEAVERALAG